MFYNCKTQRSRLNGDAAVIIAIRKRFRPTNQLMVTV